MAITSKVENITPELAAHYLKRNVDNYRKISKSKVNLYAQEMKAGKWQTNGEGIVFSESGKLKNGQHRLAAIMVAGVPVEMMVINGVPEEVTIYDNGYNRSMSQIAEAAGCGNISGTETAAGTAIVGLFNKTTKGQVLDWLKDHYTDLKRAYNLCGANARKCLSSRASCVLAAYMMDRLEKMPGYEIEVFFKVFNSGNVVGTDGYEPSSALVARRAFEERYKNMVSGSRVIKEQTQILILALRDFQKKKTRQMNYQVKEPMECVEMVRKIRKEDGLE
jgi:hypothetical protein